MFDLHGTDNPSQRKVSGVENYMKSNVLGICIFHTVKV